MPHSIYWLHRDCFSESAIQCNSFRPEGPWNGPCTGTGIRKQPGPDCRLQGSNRLACDNRPSCLGILVSLVSGMLLLQPSYLLIGKSLPEQDVNQCPWGRLRSPF